MKWFLYLLLCIFIGCSPRMQQPPEPVKPSWLSAKPFPQGYYTGIGHCLKDGSNNYIQIAKRSALDDLVSEIKVTVSSTSVLSQLDVNKEFQEKYEQIIQTSAADEIEEFELVDAWQDASNYWVYYRLSKARYQQLKEEQKRNAILLATDYYKKGLEADGNGDRIQAVNFYFHALRSIEKYLAEAIRVTVDEREILLTNEIYASIQLLMDKIDLKVEPSELMLNRRLNQNTQTVYVKAVYKDNGKPSVDLPLQAFFVKGDGDVFPEYKTDYLGQSKILLNKIGSRELEQTVGIKINTEILTVNATSSPIFSLIVKTLHVPYTQIMLRVQRPLVYVTSEEKSFGFSRNSDQISNKLKNLLAKAGFEFTSDKASADLWFDIRTDAEKGAITGSIYVTYLTGVVKVTAVKEEKEVYSSSFDRIKGYGLDYDRSSIDAYAKASDTLEKERMMEILSTVLQ